MVVVVAVVDEEEWRKSFEKFGLTQFSILLGLYTLRIRAYNWKVRVDVCVYKQRRSVIHFAKFYEAFKSSLSPPF